MKKRGQLVFITIIVIVVALLVGLLYPKIAKTLATGDMALKIAATRDIALIIDAIYSSPYDIEIDYDYDLSKLIVDISQSSVKIYDASLVSVDNGIIQGSDPNFAKYSFVPVDDNPNIILDRPKRILFSKTDGRLTIRGIR
jgi:hypothetical protein